MIMSTHFKNQKNNSVYFALIAEHVFEPDKADHGDEALRSACQSIKSRQESMSASTGAEPLKLL
jgi:hypothetical protein